MSTQNHRAFVAQVAVKDGKPDLELPASASYWKELDGLWHARWGEYYLLAFKVGMLGDDVVVVGVGSPRILRGLQHLGAKVALLKDAWQNPTRRQWLIDHGVSEIDGNPKPPVVYAGDDPFMVGADLGVEE